MILLVCGGREYDDKARVYDALDRVHAKHGVDLVIEGDGTGADRLAGLWAMERGIHTAKVAALWGKHGRSAGPKRNRAMRLLKPDAVVAFPGGRGTADMVNVATEAGIPVWSVSA